MVSRPRPDQPERQFYRLLERIDRLETMVYGRSSSVTNGRTRFIGPESLVVEGSQLVSGELKVSGEITVTGDITILPGGKIQVGDMVIDPSGGGSVSFPGGAEVSADPGGGIRMIQGVNRVYVGSGLVSMQMGTRTIAISSSGISLLGIDTITSAAANGAPVGTIWSDSSGKLYRVDA